MSFHEAVDGLYLCTTCNVVSRDRLRQCTHHYVIRQREYRPDVALPNRNRVLEYGIESYATTIRDLRVKKEPQVSTTVPATAQSRARWRLFLSCLYIVLRDPDARAMLREILADHQRVLASSGDRLLSRAVVYGSTALAICWHLGVFKALSSVMKLIERVFTRRA